MALESSTPATEDTSLASPSPHPSKPEAVARPSPSESAPPAICYRLRFRKAGDLRLVSHHDLMHVFERLFRRAGIPILYSKGFNPHPRVRFAQSLALGIVGENEVLEIDVREPMDPGELRDRMNRFLPSGIEIRSAREIPTRNSAQVRRAFFRLEALKEFDSRAVSSHETVDSSAGGDLESRVAAFLAAPSCVIVRERPNRRRFDLRPYVQDLRVVEDRLEMALWVTPHGSARPDEIVNVLGISDRLDAGAVLVRTDLELYDEAVDATPPSIPTMLHPAKEDDNTEFSNASNTERQVAHQPTSLVSNPMSFDT